MQEKENTHKALVWSQDLCDLTITEQASTEAIRQQLADYLESLAQTNFTKLIALLYRIDVSETKARQALARRDECESAGSVLADLIIERLLEKLAFRARYKAK